MLNIASNLKIFFEGFFRLAYRNVKETTRIDFLNADWRDFESTPASKENSDNQSACLITTEYYLKRDGK